MTVDQLIRQAQAGGIQLAIKGGRLRITGSSRPDDALLDGLREHKVAILARLSLPAEGAREESEESEETPQRYGCAPTTAIPLTTVPPGLPAGSARLLEDYVLRQSGGEPGPALDWVMRQANSYWEMSQPHWSHEDCDHAAALDLVIWQRGARMQSTTRHGATREIIVLLKELDEVARDLPEAIVRPSAGGSRW